MEKNLKSNIALGVIIAFLLNAFGTLPFAQAQEFVLPAPGVMVSLSPEFNPPILKGLKVHPENPFRFDFILDKGDQNNRHLNQESTKLIKYFLASLTIPELDLWVNLSPYEKNRIIPQSFGMTEMGRDLLAEDYMLKQITASLIYPEGETGKKFWKRIYEEAAKKFGTTNIPVNTFNKVWIIPDKAVVYENVKAKTAYVVEAKLKVMLEQDYLSLEKHAGGVIASQAKQSFSSGSNIIREIVIPELTKEVNQGKNFSQLRQVYNSLILATWYKKKIRDSILAQIYADKNKIAGVEPLVSLRGRSPKQSFQKIASSPTAPRNDTDIDFIYQRYLQAFKKGVYNYIKEEPDTLTNQMIPRKYFSGGVGLRWGIDGAMSVNDDPSLVRKVLGFLNPDHYLELSADVKPEVAASGPVSTDLLALIDAIQQINGTLASRRVIDDISAGHIPGIKKTGSVFKFTIGVTGGSVVQARFDYDRNKVNARPAEEIDEARIKKIFINLFLMITKNDVNYDSNFLSILNHLLIGVENYNPEMSMDFVKTYKVPVVLFYLANQNKRMADDLFNNLLIDLSIFMADQWGPRITFDVGGKNMFPTRKETRKVAEGYLARIFEKDRQEVRRLAELNAQRAREEQNRLLQEQSLQKEKKKINVDTPFGKVNKPISVEPPQQIVQQPRQEKIRLPPKDRLDVLLQSWDRENGLRIMARKSKDLGDFIERLVQYAQLKNGTAKIEVENRLAHFANSQGMSKEEFFEFLLKANGNRSGQVLQNKEIPARKSTALSISIYKSRYVNKNWGRLKNVIMAKLNDAFSDENISLTTQSFMYRWVPGIYRFKIPAEGGGEYSIYVRYYDQEKRILLFGFDMQAIFHAKKEGGLDKTFRTFLIDFDDTIQYVNSNEIEKLQDAAMMGMKIKDVLPKQFSRSILILNNDEIDKYIEEPWQEAMMILLAKNILTLTTTANGPKADLGRGTIVLDIKSLSEENLQIAKHLGVVDEDYIDGPAIRIDIPLHAQMPVEEFSQRAVAIAEQFKKQKATWIESFSYEELIQRFPFLKDLPVEEIRNTYYFDQPEGRYYFTKEQYLRAKDKAQMISGVENQGNGGIDLTPDHMKVQVKTGSPKGIFTDDKGIKFHLDPAMLAVLQNVPGFVPVVIKIRPLRNLWEFLGIAPS